MSCLKLAWCVFAGEELTMDAEIQKTKNYKIALFSGAFICLNLAVLKRMYVDSDMDIHQEGHLLENVQAVAFLLSGLCLIVALLRARGFMLWMRSFYCLTCFLAVVREVDVERMDVPDIVISFGSGILRNIVFGGLFVLLIILFFFKYRWQMKKWKLWIKTNLAVVCLLGCGFILLGDLFEKLDIDHLEELMETNGALLIGLGALILSFRSSEILQISLKKCGSKKDAESHCDAC